MSSRQSRSRDGMLRGERRCLGDDRVVAAELDLGLEPVLERGQAELVEPAISSCRNDSNARSANGGPRQSASASRSAADRSAGGSGARVAHEPLEAARVDRARIDLQHVAGRAGLDRLAAEHPAQTGDGVLDDASAVGGGSPLQRSSSSVSIETTAPAWSARSASSARCLGPPSGSLSRAECTSSGPSRRNST